MNGLTLAAGTFQFSPTSADTTVSDNNAIAYVFNAEDVDDIFWMLPDNSGVVCGTQGGEWMIAASTLNDPLTPTSIQAHRRSKYKSANIQAVHAGLSLLFVQANGQRTIEYVADVFSGKFLGRNLNEKSKHLTTTGIAQMAYQQDKVPIVWERNGKGQLIGTTYKRESSFTSEPPTFNGWHEHTLGSGRIVESISVGPSVNGDLESLTAVTNQTTVGASDYNIRHVEMLTDMFDENNTIYQSWFVDDAVTPSAAVENGPPGTQVTLYGMFHLAGKTVSVMAGGVDMGDYVVAADGTVVIPINQLNGQQASALFTDAYLTALFNNGVNYGSLAVPTNQTVSVQYPGPAGQTIQSYLSSTVPVCNGIIDDFAGNRMFSTHAGATSSDGIAVFNRFTGALKIQRSAVSIMTSTANQVTSNSIPFSPLTLGTDGFLYTCSDAANSSCLRKIDPVSLNIVASFGLVSGSFLLDNVHFPSIKQSVGVKVDGTNYLVYIGSSSTLLSVINVDSMSYAGHLYNYAEAVTGQLCAGLNSYSAVYSIACKANDNTDAAGIYRTTISAFANGFFLPPILPAYSALNLPVNGFIGTTRIAQIHPAIAPPPSKL